MRQQFSRYNSRKARQRRFGSGDYHADAVHFDGATALHIASLLAAGDNTGFVTASVWQKIAHPFAGQLWTVDPEGNYTSNQYYSGGGTEVGVVYLAAGDGSKSMQADTALDGDSLTPDVYQHLLISASTNLAAGNKVLNIYVNDSLHSRKVSDASAAFLMTFNGKSFWVGDDSYGNYITGDYADIWIAPGVFIDFTVEANRRKFISVDNKPVYLGANGELPTGTAPAVFFSGNASGFATNKGTGGAFTLTGSLTNAATSPSD